METPNVLRRDVAVLLGCASAARLLRLLEEARSSLQCWSCGRARGGSDLGNHGLQLLRGMNHHLTTRRADP